jgi:hypothetical protein
MQGTHLPCELELKLLLLHTERLFENGGDFLPCCVSLAGACDGPLCILNCLYRIGQRCVHIEEAKFPQLLLLWCTRSIHH